jgi:hypothetical protein
MVTDQDSRSVLRLTLGLGGGVLILAGMMYMSTLVNQVLLAAFLTLLMVPVSGWLQKYGLSKAWANVLVVVFVLVVVVLLGIFIVYSLAGLVKELPGYESNLDATKGQIQTQLESLGVDGATVTSDLTAAAKQVLGLGASIAANWVGYAVDLVFTLSASARACSALSRQIIRPFRASTTLPRPSPPIYACSPISTLSSASPTPFFCGRWASRVHCCGGFWPLLPAIFPSSASGSP